MVIPSCSQTGSAAVAVWAKLRALSPFFRVQKISPFFLSVSLFLQHPQLFSPVDSFDSLYDEESFVIKTEPASAVAQTCPFDTTSQGMLGGRYLDTVQRRSCRVSVLLPGGGGGVDGGSTRRRLWRCLMVSGVVGGSRLWFWFGFGGGELSRNGRYIESTPPVLVATLGSAELERETRKRGRQKTQSSVEGRRLPLIRSCSLTCSSIMGAHACLRAAHSQKHFVFFFGRADVSV